MSHHSESGRTEQILSQFLLKTLHAVLASRIPLLHAPPSRPPDLDPAAEAARARKHDRWFNLALGDLPPPLDHPDFLHHNVMDPLLIDIILCPREESTDPEAIVERWSLHCEPPPPTPPSPGGAEPSLSYRKMYKKTMLLLRSIYSILRLLPAYRVFRVQSSSNQCYNYEISYKVSSFAEPFSRQEEEELRQYSFSPVKTQLGQLSVSVTYRPNLSDFNLEVSQLLPPRIISDYVGSPAADPMRAFPASPSDNGARPTSFPLRGVRSSASPSLQRPHSWTSAPSMTPATVSNLRPSPPDVYGQWILNQRSLGHRKGSTFLEEFRLSPPFSPSPTPSPPTHGSSPLRARMNSETAPVSIPGKSQLYRGPNFSDPTRSFLPPPSPRSMRMDRSSQESPESRSLRKLEGLRVGDYYSNFHLSKGLKDGKDDSGRFSGVFSSGGSPRFGFSRSSSRLSMQDDPDDLDFSCPFAVDDVDSSDSQTRNLDGKEAPESAQPSTSFRKSQDAAVGILVQMLRTAPPLRQDHSYSSQSSKSQLDGEVGTSSFFASRKTSDALEELRSFREMKDMLLSQSGTPLLGSVKERTK